MLRRAVPAASLLRKPVPPGTVASGLLRTPMLLRTFASAAARSAPAPRACAPVFLAARRLCTGSAPTLDTPFISDSVPLPEGILGTVEELLVDVGDSVEEGDVIAVVE